jgi:hypothetical protein
MRTAYRALLIDPAARTVTSVPFNGDPKTIVGAECLDFFTIAEFGLSFDQGCIDDDGLSRGEPVHAFRFDNRDDPIAGRCLVIGARIHSGEACDAMMSIAFVREHVQWLGRILPHVQWEQTDTGARTVVSWEPAP